MNVYNIRQEISLLEAEGYKKKKKTSKPGSIGKIPRVVNRI